MFAAFAYFEGVFAAGDDIVLDTCGLLPAIPSGEGGRGTTLMAAFAQTGRKIVAIGRNYAKHAKELGNAIPEKPFFFLKPTSSFVHTGGQVEIPKGIVVHHEGKQKANLTVI